MFIGYSCNGAGELVSGDGCVYRVAEFPNGDVCVYVPLGGTDDILVPSETGSGWVLRKNTSEMEGTVLIDLTLLTKPHH